MSVADTPGLPWGWWYGQRLGAKGSWTGAEGSTPMVTSGGASTLRDAPVAEPVSSATIAAIVAPAVIVGVLTLAVAVFFILRARRSRPAAAETGRSEAATDPAP